MSKDEAVLHHGQCHCGKITFSILHPPDFDDVGECNCSICYAKGFLSLSLPAPSLVSLTGKENLTTYTFNTHTAQHYFCKTCGISPLTVPRSDPHGYNINFRCLGREKVGRVRVTPRDGVEWEKHHSVAVGGELED